MVDICLSEIDHCAYFVGFIGARYGWRPGREDIAAPTFTKFPFLNTYIPGRSVTEMEILHGALGTGPNCHLTPSDAFFYHRAESFYETVPAETIDIFKEKDAFASMKLRDLKRRINVRYQESQVTPRPATLPPMPTADAAKRCQSCLK